MPAPSPLPGFEIVGTAPSDDVQFPAWNTDYTFAGWFTSIYADGASGGQTIIGGTGAGEDLELKSTSHATAGHVIVTGCGIRLDNNQKISWFNAAGTFVREVIYLNASNQLIIAGVPDGGGDVRITTSSGTVARFAGSAVEFLGGSLSAAGLRIGTTTVNTGWSGSSTGCAFSVVGTSIIDLNGFGVKPLSRTDANRGSASSAGAGRQIYNTDHSRIQVSNGSIWLTYVVQGDDITAGDIDAEDITADTVTLTGGISAGGNLTATDATLNSVDTNSLTHGPSSGGVVAATFANPTTTINWANGNTQTLELTDDTTIAFSNALTGQSLLLFIAQDGTGGHAITWPAEVNWGDAGEPEMPTDPSVGMWVRLIYVGSSVYHGKEGL